MADVKRKRRKRWPWIVGGMAVVLIIVGACGTPPAPPTRAPYGVPAPGAPGAPAAPATPSGKEHTVTYDVIGAGKSMRITYTKQNGMTSQATDVPLPWTTNVQITGGYAALVMTAQNGASGEIRCRISVDGKSVAENSSSGRYAVASCNHAGML